MGGNPAIPPGVGRRLKIVCRCCGTLGVTVKGIDEERQFAIVQCDSCSNIASADSKSLFGPDEGGCEQSPLD